MKRRGCSVEQIVAALKRGGDWLAGGDLLRKAVYRSRYFTGGRARPLKRFGSECRNKAFGTDSTEMFSPDNSHWHLPALSARLRIPLQVDLGRSDGQFGSGGIFAPHFEVVAGAPGF